MEKPNTEPDQSPSWTPVKPQEQYDFHTHLPGAQRPWAHTGTADPATHTHTPHAWAWRGHVEGQSAGAGDRHWGGRDPTPSGRPGGQRSPSALTTGPAGSGRGAQGQGQHSPAVPASPLGPEAPAATSGVQTTCVRDTGGGRVCGNDSMGLQGGQPVPSAVSTSAALNTESARVLGGRRARRPLCPPQLSTVRCPAACGARCSCLLPWEPLGAWPSPQGAELGPKEGKGEVARRGNPAPCPRDCVQPSLDGVGCTGWGAVCRREAPKRTQASASLRAALSLT